MYEIYFDFLSPENYIFCCLPSIILHINSLILHLINSSLAKELILLLGIYFDTGEEPKGCYTIKILFKVGTYINNSKISRQLVKKNTYIFFVQ